MTQKPEDGQVQFLLTQVAHLGHIIGRNGVKFNPAQIVAIRKFTRTKTFRAIQHFLGLSGFLLLRGL